MAPSEARLEALRDQLARMERGGGGAAFPPLPLALALALAPAIDRHLPGAQDWGATALGRADEVRRPKPGSRRPLLPVKSRDFQ